LSNTLVLAPLGAVRLFFQISQMPSIIVIRNN
jgi:hypothetical protein